MEKLLTFTGASKLDVPDAMPRAGWVKLMRSQESMELLSHFQNAFRLACLIAIRARWRDGFNAHGLAQGECLLGDFRSYGMTEKEYRGAKQKLEKHGFAAFRRANRGTVARLMDTRLFDTSPPPEGGHKGEQRADEGRTEGDKRSSKADSKTSTDRTGVSSQAQKRPHSVLDVIQFALSRFDYEPAEARKWCMEMDRQGLWQKPATEILESFTADDNLHAALKLAFRFVMFNNSKRWQLDKSWRAAFAAFDGHCANYGTNNLRLEWVPCIADELETDIRK